MATVRIQVRRGTASQWSTTNPVLAAGEMGVETDTNLFKFGNGTSTWTALSYANNSDVAISEISQDAINNALSLGAGLTKSYNDGTNTIEITVDSDVIALKSYVDEREIWIQNQADSAYIPQEDRGSANGVASLNAQSKVPTSEIDTTVISTRAYAEYLQGQDLAALTIHADNSLNVHGIADTSLLATDGDVLDALNEAKSYADTKHTDAQNLITSLSTSSQTYADTKKTEAIAAAEAYTDSAVDTATEYADTIGTTAASFATGAVSTHNSTTANVHGIADTTALATKSYADTAADAAETAAISAASSSLSTHAADTTSVHGIADTSVLATATTVATAKSEAIAAAGTAADGKISTAVGALTKSSVGLGNVDNTSDANKPISSATQTALDLKAPKAAPTFTGTLTAADVTISGNLTVSGTTTTVNTTNFTTSDPVIYLGEGNNANLVDIGFVGSYNDGTYAHQGLVKDSSDGKWKLFKGVTDEPTTTVNFAQGSLDALKVGAFEATTVTPSSGVVFSDGTQTKEGVPSRTPIIQKTDSYTLSALTERDSLIEVAKASAATITIPADSAVNFPIGTSIDILQTSTGQVTIAGAGGVTVNATPGLKLRTQWSSASLFKRAANTWIVMGDLSA